MCALGQDEPSGSSLCPTGAGVRVANGSFHPSLKEETVQNGAGEEAVGV